MYGWEEEGKAVCFGLFHFVVSLSFLHEKSIGGKWHRMA